MKYFIGIDPSLSGLAYVCLDENKNIHDYFTMTTLKNIKNDFEISLFKLDNINKLIFIVDNIINRLNDLSNNEIYIGLEGYSYGSSSRSVTGMAELSGYIKIMLYKNKYKYDIIPPSVAKKFISGKGNANKDLVKNSCLHLKIEIPWNKKSYKRYDLYDALSIALYIYDKNK